MKIQHKRTWIANKADPTAVDEYTFSNGTAIIDTLGVLTMTKCEGRRINPTLVPQNSIFAEAIREYEEELDEYYNGEGYEADRGFYGGV